MKFRKEQLAITADIALWYEKTIGTSSGFCGTVTNVVFVKELLLESYQNFTCKPACKYILNTPYSPHFVL